MREAFAGAWSGTAVMVDAFSNVLFVRQAMLFGSHALMLEAATMI